MLPTKMFQAVCICATGIRLLGMRIASQMKTARVPGGRSEVTLALTNKRCSLDTYVFSHVYIHLCTYTYQETTN